jgi:hypothetical protein
MNRLIEENLKKHLPEDVSLEKFQKTVYVMRGIQNVVINSRNKIKNNKQ